jgi:DNA modification methylase
MLSKRPLAIEYREAASLAPYAHNPRTHSERQVSEIAASMRAFGWTNPILVDEEGGIIAGHGRLLAAQQLGMSEVPVIELRGLSGEQKRALVLADNKLALNAGWDTDLLALELGELQTAGFDLSLTGFSDDEIAGLFSLRTPGLTDPDDIPPLPDEPISRIGDLWLPGSHRLLCGDSTNPDDVRRALDGVKPHLLVSDPPYGVEYQPEWRSERGVNDNKRKLGHVKNDDRADWREAWALFPGDVAYVWHASWFTSIAQTALESAGFQIRAQIIWGKDRFALSRGHYHWQHEPCWYAVRGTAHWTGDRSQSTLWTIPSRDDRGHGHGTQKPVECMRRPMLNNSSPGQAVYDPFVGSGTSIIAAETIGRVCHAIEISPAYVDVAITRWQDFTGRQATLEDDGRTFAEVTAERRPGEAPSPSSSRKAA